MAWIVLDSMPAEKPPWPVGVRAWYEAIRHVTVRPIICLLQMTCIMYLISLLMQFEWSITGRVLTALGVH